MNLARHAAVIWRYRTVAAAGISLGLILAILASYSVSWKSGPRFTPRGEELWTAVSKILVTQPGFPEGRVTLPTKQTADAVTSEGQPANVAGAPPRDQVEFADPARLANLADLYSKFLSSADILDRVKGRRPKASQVLASPFSASSGGQVLPIIELTTFGDSAKEANRLNHGTFAALKGVLAERQAANSITTGRRVEVRLIDPPATELTAGRSRTMSILALILSMLGTIAVIHILQAVRGKGDPEDDFIPAVRPRASMGPLPFDETAPERLKRPELVTTPGGERRIVRRRPPP